MQYHNESNFQFSFYLNNYLKADPGLLEQGSAVTGDLLISFQIRTIPYLIDSASICKSTFHQPLYMFNNDER